MSGTDSQDLMDQKASVTGIGKNIVKTAVGKHDGRVGENPALTMHQAVSPITMFGHRMRDVNKVVEI